MNLEDIARLSGTSRSTVSRVINNASNVSQQTRERVLSIINEVDFQPNTAARGLAAGRTRVLGLVIPMGVSTLFTDPYFPTLIKGISSACNQQDLSVMLWLAEPDYERRTSERVLNNGMIDGVIVASMLLDDPIVAALQKASMPFVLIGRHPTDESIWSVDVESLESSRRVVTYLLQLGHRRIATITGPQNMIAGHDRLAGYRMALEEWGMSPSPRFIATGDFSTEGGYAAMNRLLPHKPDAVYAASDTMAVGAIRAILEEGLSVPEDIAVIGFDDMPFASSTTPPLTTIRQPIEQTGAQAVRLLTERIQYPTTPPKRVLLPTELVIRESCGLRLSAPK